MPPLRAALEAEGLGDAYVEWHVTEGSVDMSVPPPPGVFLNRMSPSSNTRGHAFAPELTAVIIDWLTAAGRTVLNGATLRLELSKTAQYAALAAAGVPTPRTVAVVGTPALLAAAAAWPREEALILKPNRGGKGSGVRLFASPADLVQAVKDGEVLVPRGDASHAAANAGAMDGVLLLQQYIRAPDATITRAEFVDGSLLYCTRVSTAQGFELCPADACEAPAKGVGSSTPTSLEGLACPAATPASARFTIMPDGSHPPALIEALQRFLAAAGYAAAGVEYITDAEGRHYVYDVNACCNYNGPAEAVAGKSGMAAHAAMLKRALQKA